MTSNIIIAKGAYSVTLQTVEVSDNLKNEIRLIVLPTTKQNQAAGPKTNKAIDLLKITHSMNIRGIIMTTADRDNLIKIAKGADIAGSPATLTYSTYPGSPLSVFVTELNIVEASLDRDTSNDRKYQVQITVLEGVSA